MKEKALGSANYVFNRNTKKEFIKEIIIRGILYTGIAAMVIALVYTFIIGGF